MHLAQLNVRRLVAETDDPRVAEFMAALDRVNGLGKRMPGFVWMMEGSGEPGRGNTDVKIDGDPCYVANLTVWDLGTGNVGIGTEARSDAKLAVNGTIAAKDVTVTLDDWPDFVFAPHYDLMPLPELAAFVAQHKHLPGIPAETEVRVKGVSLGDTQAKLLRKVEELTLYTIQLQRENQDLRDELRRQTDLLERRIASLEQR